MKAVFDSLPDDQLAPVAVRYLEYYSPSPAERNLIQDLIWVDIYTPEIPRRYRHDLARALAIDDLYLNVNRFHDLLERLWVLSPSDELAEMLGIYDDSLRAEIKQHVYRNPGDWSVEYLFERLGAFNSSDLRFKLFLEGLAASDVNPDESSQRRLVQKVNEALRPCGVEMRETDTDGGYPVFSLISTQTASAGRPKNLIFASSHKPDLRFKDAINNDIEIVTHVDDVLVYDLPIGDEGLRWSDLQSWWQAKTSITNAEQAKKELFLRLQNCLPLNSPPQRLLFRAFYSAFGPAIPALPALLPEVWLHWDPKTVRERGRDALFRFRMDFLMLLPHRVRVVLEVDGKHHYASADGSVDEIGYAKMMSADRELKMAGYEVFRFGAKELNGKAGESMIQNFFQQLFKRYGVVYSGIAHT